MPYIESFEEFRTRQDCPFVATPKAFLFENGARSDGSIHYDPPTEPRYLLPLQIAYLQGQLKVAERKHRQCHDYIVTQAEYHGMGAGPAPAESAYTELKDFQQEVFRLRKAIAAKRAEAEKLRGPSHADRYNEKRDRERTTANDAVARLMGLNI